MPQMMRESKSAGGFFIEPKRSPFAGNLHHMLFTRNHRLGLYTYSALPLRPLIPNNRPPGRALLMPHTLHYHAADLHRRFSSHLSPPAGEFPLSEETTLGPQTSFQDLAFTHTQVIEGEKDTLFSIEIHAAAAQLPGPPAKRLDAARAYADAIVISRADVFYVGDYLVRLNCGGGRVIFVDDSLIQGTPRVVFMEAILAESKAFMGIWALNSPIDWMLTAPTADLGSTLAFLCFERHFRSNCRRCFAKYFLGAVYYA
ncbi:hypothetical protein B9Z19DRAFT_1118935 [Tuber borchii]|uniref:Uncharacterized protein n=1 Tax=Tuber borchii TaxID=42251 RepID=A0A2T7A775_TUBBO|nr:hypothetical protein B9Z19DRAFT_1118935 [Tuber borchii]